MNLCDACCCYLHLRAQVSIVWRGNTLGFMQRHDAERSSEQQGHYLDNVAVTLAGRAAEDVCCGTISSGCSSDLKHVSADCADSVTITSLLKCRTAAVIDIPTDLLRARTSTYKLEFIVIVCYTCVCTCMCVYLLRQLA
jgi:Peptidase family M41